MREPEAVVLTADEKRVEDVIMRWCDGHCLAAKEEGFERPHYEFLKLIAGLIAEERDACARAIRGLMWPGTDSEARLEYANAAFATAITAIEGMADPETRARLLGERT